MPANRPVRVVLVDDHEVAVEGFRALLKQHQDRVVVVDVRVIGEPGVDVILFEPDGQSEATRQALRDLVRDSGAPAAAYTWSDERVENVETPAVGPRLPGTLSGEQLVDAIEAIHDGGAGTLVVNRESRGDQLELTPREAEILALITRGLTNAEIAAELYLSINSVKTYIRSGYRKIGVSRRTQAVAWGMSHGLSARSPATPA